LDEPHIAGSQLHGELHGCYKIKLRKVGYRLIYSVEDDTLVVLVLAVNRRDGLLVYSDAINRL
jgi:mRNA interferase RelE/StbE